MSRPNKLGKWYLDGVEMKASAHIRLTSEGSVHSLAIDYVELDDEGTYKVEVDGVSSVANVYVDGE